MKDYSYIFDGSLSFDERALRVFGHQYEHNDVYRQFCDALSASDPAAADDIPLIPVEAFRDAEMKSFRETNEDLLYFRSSGTTSMKRSKHFVKEPGIYAESILKGFMHFYSGSDPVILAYTPGYNENPESSLIYMLNVLISEYQPDKSRFLEVGKPLDPEMIRAIEGEGHRIILFGAAFGLLDLIGMESVTLPEDSIILETGGMKTHRREMSREQLHSTLAEGFGIPESQVHSEYGMTELLSQAYSQGDEWFRYVPWMQVSIRDPEDPMKRVEAGQEGLIGLIDLANLYSCSFILTGDKGVQRPDGSFRVLGRWNPSDLRGCNFLIDRD